MEWSAQLVEIEVTDADVEAVLDCLRSGWLTMGPRTQRLEATLAERFGVKHAIAVSSGSAALHLACRAIGFGPGDEVIVPDFAFVAAAHTPRYLGADVVLCDTVAEDDPGLDLGAVERAITPRTKAVVVAHMWGYAAAAEELRALCDERGLALIEDCAQAIDARTEDGAVVGSIGELGCFSFFSKKQLSIGEGGLVTTDDDDFAATVKSLRSHAMSSVTWERHRGHGLGYDVTDIGYNYRIDEPRAALAGSRLERLSDDIEARRRAAVAYRERLSGLDGLDLPFDDEAVARSSHFAFPVLLADLEAREKMGDSLRAAGVQTTNYPALHTLTEYHGAGRSDGLANAKAIADRHLCLPLHPLLDEPRVELVTEAIAAALVAPVR